MDREETIRRLYASVGETCVTDPAVAHVEIHGNRVLGLHLVEGLEVEAQERDDGIDAQVIVAPGARIAQPVRICFGLLPESGVQRIGMTVEIGDGASIAVLASCTFPNALEVLHTMDASIRVGRDADYAYLERHVHGDRGGVKVVPKASVALEEGARFRTDFELIQGAAGAIDIDYDARCAARAVLEMNARIRGRGEDRIDVHEQARLEGEAARAVLTTSIAVRDRARADIKNTLVASAPRARGHVDCKEIVQGEAVARAVPIVEVNHPTAHVTHEAALGAVDSRQLQTLMSRGLDEDAATELIIRGLLRPAIS
jgi:Fe-S cluster assembly scaffold protein SufB